MAQFAAPIAQRLFSLDVYRGTIMFLLIAEAAGFHHSFLELTHGTFLEPVALQLHHHPWNGLRFWDLIQPFFMFIVGVAMPFSLRKRLLKGNKREVTQHILKRCFLLFSFGVLLHCVYNHALVWELWNVLVQLAFTILIAYAIMGMSNRSQIFVSVVLLVSTELLYRGFNPGAPYAEGHDSFGAFVDILVMGKVNSGYWVFINFVPTAAHTIWGVLCGQLLLTDNKASSKLKLFLIWGTSILVLGVALDVLQITPIIKRIATSSFTLVSGGLAILSLSFFYWSIDVRKNHKKWLTFFSVVGTNAIFIYLFAETVGAQWFRDFGLIWTKGILLPLGVSKILIVTLNSLVVLFIFWYITYFLNKKGIFFKV